ncbi:Uncharacterised protein [Chryseobacterium gleum]|uniref:Hyaluronidase n=2 Tax=Chryseobacterium gleum TaxID=250 RepID=A0A448B2I0_CHRGE|nr:hyaluronoglucosaminidase superfamily protein [Chryseobacterium gleum]EFK33067.1 hyaluronoglucosaminidase [Chryseobacterium gleum ATCC 35910]QBJ86398.1 hypothetical protein DDI74_09065 [Chryseobacterium gleum]QQY33893.1 hypothetical protein I6I60_09065 [Chryseobacterium gleum]VEE07774.1 Uncharacterised protein [Chryseobacterium gleum]
MKKIVLLLFLFFISCNSSSQVKNNQTKFYYSLGKIGSKAENYLKSTGGEEVGFLDEGQFISRTSDKYLFLPDLLEKEINRGIPDKNQKGVVYIDLEMPFDDMLGEDDKSAMKAMDYCLKVLRFAKKARPNIKFGLYAIPFTSVWSPNDEFYAKQNKFAPLLKECDIFFPSLYTFYSNPAAVLANGNYLENNLNGLIKLGVAYKKPVYVFMWHRYHNSNEKDGMKEISDKIWKEQMETVASQNVNGKFVDGILWWGADAYFYERPEAENMRKEFKGTLNNFISHNDESIIRKAKIIKDVLQSKK